MLTLLNLFLVSTAIEILLITAPMMTQGVNIDLPSSEDSELKQSTESLVITINKVGDCFIGDSEQGVKHDQIRKVFDQYSEREKQQPIYLQASKDVPYRLVVETLSNIKSAGFEKVNILAEP